MTKKKDNIPLDSYPTSTPILSSRETAITRTSIPPAPKDSISGWNPLDAFLSEIQQYPLLSPDEERSLAEEYVKTGDVQAAARLVTSNLRLVVKIAFEYRRAYRNIMDLVQEGNIGLMQAVKKFDPARGVKLSTYAAWWIRAYILRFVLNNWRLVKIGTTQSQRKLFFNLNKERAKLVSNGDDPTAELLAERLGVDAKDICEMEQRLRSHDLSLDAEIYDSEGKPLTRMELLEDEQRLPFDLFENKEFNKNFEDRLDRFASSLSGKEDFIFRKRLISDNPMTLQEIGNHFEISRERVRQIEMRLLQRLRRFLENELPGYFNDGM